MIDDYHCPERDYHKLRLYVCRSLFPMIYPYCFNIVLPAKRNPNEGKMTFYQKLKALQLRPPADLDIPPEFIQTPENEGGRRYNKLYAYAIDRLRDLELSLVPTDMLEIIWSTVTEITTEAMARTGSSTPLSADVLLPLFEYVLLQAEVFDIHRTLAYVQRFTHPHEKRGEFGWCLTTLEAIVEDVERRIVS